jgi:hypothetical protein
MAEAKKPGLFGRLFQGPAEEAVEEAPEPSPEPAKKGWFARLRTGLARRQHRRRLHQAQAR